MKTLTFFLVLLAPILSEAQNWQNICTAGITLYADPNNNLSSFRLDSAEAVPGHPIDSIFSSYPTLRKFTASQTCFDTTHGSVLGEKVYKKADGTFIFFNHYGDSIVLRTDASLNQSWRIFSLADTGYLLATVTEIKNDYVCTLPDQVKIISLQAYNNLNQSINHIFNNKQIVLSKQYGLKQIYDLVTFPSDTVQRILKGKSAPQIGLQNFSIQDAYNYEIGDEFHYYYFYGCGLGVHTEKKIHIFLSKYISITGDTIIYSIDRCAHIFDAPPIYHQKIHDTIYDTVIIHNMPFYLEFANQPLEFVRKSTNTCDLYQHTHGYIHNRYTKRFYIDYAKSSASHCWTVKQWEPFYDYTEGLGQTKFYNEYLYYHNYNWYVVEQDWEMVYYRKGSETWGTPLAANCDSLLVDIPKTPDEINPTIRISPNPVTERSEISVTGFQPMEAVEIRLYDCYGREVYRKNSDTEPYYLNRDGLPDGFYILKLRGFNSHKVVTAKVILR